MLLDTVTEGAADPWGIALSPDGGTAWISIAGAHQIARIELGRLHELLAGQTEKSDTRRKSVTTRATRRPSGGRSSKTRPNAINSPITSAPSMRPD